MPRRWQTFADHLPPDADPTLVARLRQTLDELSAWEQRIPDAQSCDVAVATQRTLEEARTLAARLGLTID